ncbi:MAG: phenylalanine 4-monooxygenase [Aureispira sp.]|nr:phenylalanine 4-monooxygenase [Aureispira sp.]
MQQNYEAYTSEDHKVWSLLYDEQMKILPSRAAKAYLKGIETTQFEREWIPKFTTINKELKALTGWQVYAVPGLIDNKPFFELLSQKQFPATTWLRTLAQLKYIEEPDMFHDVFGHVPLLSEPFFCQFLNGLSALALEHIDNPSAIELMARIYWYTIEFGLIKEDGEVKIYGAGILSSPGESVSCLEPTAIHLDFDVQLVLSTPYIKDTFQGQYFVVESYEQLSNSLKELKTLVEGYIAQGVEVKEGEPLSVLA